MKWTNALGPDTRRATFNYVDRSNVVLGHIVIRSSDVAWYAKNSCGVARKVGHAKRAVETLARVTI